MRPDGRVRIRPPRLAALALAAMAVANAAGGAVAATGAVERFAGAVRRGEQYERTVFGGLRFRLTPDPGEPSVGWTIGLFAADSTADLVAVATPPYHGVNPRMIEAWHFRDPRNSGPNRGDVNAPQRERLFRFVADPGDYAAVAAALDLALWPNGRPEASVDSAVAVLDSLSAGEGRLRIRDLRLGGLGAGLTPVIEAMSFEVTLSRPPR